MEMALELQHRMVSLLEALIRQEGKRLSKHEMCDRLRIHRNTLLRRQKEPGFPQPDINGYWLLADVVKWESQGGR